jgi:hypothetical protein
MHMQMVFVGALVVLPTVAEAAPQRIVIQTIAVSSATPSSFVVREDASVTVGALKATDFKLRAFRGTKAQLPSDGIPTDDGCRQYSSTVFRHSDFSYRKGDLLLPQTNHGWLTRAGDQYAAAKWVFVLESGGPDDGLVKIAQQDVAAYFHKGIEIEFKPDAYDSAMIEIETRVYEAAYHKSVQAVSVDRGCMTLLQNGTPATEAWFAPCGAVWDALPPQLGAESNPMRGCVTSLRRDAARLLTAVGHVFAMRRGN